MSNIPTSRIFSNPKSSAARLMYVLEDIIRLELKNGKTPTLRDKAITYSKERCDEVAGSMLAYRLYMEEMFENLNFFDGRTIIFLNGISPDMMLREEGIPGRVGYDAFSQLYHLSGEILKIAGAMKKENKIRIDEIFGNIVFWPVQPVDMPFIVVEDNGLMIRHPLQGIAENVNREVEPRLKFGSLEKKIDDFNAKIGNTQYSEMILGFEHFKLLHDRNASMDALEILECGSRENFYKAMHPFILLNNELMAGKYRIIMEETSLPEAYVYALKTSTSFKIMEKAAKKSGARIFPLGGEKGPLGSKKTITQLAERDETALRMLHGFLLSMHARKTGRLLRYAEPEKRIPAGIPIINFESCWAYRFFLCERGNYCSPESKPEYCTKDLIDNIDGEKTELVDKLAKTRHFGIKPIEAVFNLLNRREYELFEEGHFRNSWIRERGDRLVLPLKIKDAEAGHYDLRASEFNGSCNILGLFAKCDDAEFEREMKVKIRQDNSTVEGAAMHEIKNRHDGMVHRELMPDRARQLDRSDYCEKQAVYDYFIEKRIMEAAKDEITKYAKKHNFGKEFTDLAFGIMEERFNGSRTIKVSGHPDCLGILDDSRDERYQDILVADIKRAMYTSNERHGFVTQTLIYGLAARQMMEMQNRNFYLITVQPPFDQNAFLPEEKIIIEDLDAYRDERMMFKKVEIGSGRIERAHIDIVKRFAMQKAMLEDDRFMYFEREKHLQQAYRGCSTCFENYEKSGICPYTFSQVENGRKLIDVLGDKWIVAN